MNKLKNLTNKTFFITAIAVLLNIYSCKDLGTKTEPKDPLERYTDSLSLKYVDNIREITFYRIDRDERFKERILENYFKYNYLFNQLPKDYIDYPARINLNNTNNWLYSPEDYRERSLRGSSDDKSEYKDIIQRLQENQEKRRI